ncbi:acyl carrier protein [Corynebacterium pacaense]|uniref:acyl carrier protein n=1 Tax=Corynebacterium pacaense TaxID=1816684 RepID=UPI0009BABD95|nr:acyl carrier protein [Corynebacterium pacaense]
MSTNTPPVLDTLSTILSDVGGLSPEEIKPESRITEDLGISSLNFIEAVVHTEDAFGVRIEDSDAKEFHTVADIVDFITAGLEAGQ